MTRKVLINLILALAMLLAPGFSAAYGAPPAQEGMTYTVKLGDNLWTLAEKYLDSGHAYRDIVAATNAIHDEDASFALIAEPSLIHPGWKLLVPGAAAAAAPVPTEQSLVDPSDPGAALQGLLDSQVQEQGILGMAMAVQLADGTFVGRASGYSDPAGQSAWSVDTRTAIGSATKLFTSAAILQLIEEGRLELDDTIDVWFPEQPNGDSITIRMLLSHSSGIANYTESPSVVEKSAEEWAPMDLLSEANKLGTVGEPGGSEGYYSNTNYLLLGLIIEEVTGSSWAQEVESRIIEPLDLSNTVYMGESGVLDALIGGYTKEEDRYENLLGTQHVSLAWSAGAMVSTVSDLITFTRALFDGDLFESGETLDQMLQPLAAVDIGGGMVVQYGLGPARAEVDGAAIWGHGGDINGYHAFIGYDPGTGAVVAAVINTDEGNVLMPGIAALQYLKAAQQGDQGPAGSGAVYEDPQGRFTIPLIGKMAQLETDGTYALFEMPGLDLNMNIVTVESDDVEASVDAALRQVGVDPVALTEKGRGTWDKWSLVYYSMGDGQGVTLLAQVKDGTTYFVVGTGDDALTANPPDDFMKSIQGFTLAGEGAVLPATVEEFEAYVNSFVGDKPPGLSVVIALGGDVIYAKGFGMADGPRGMATTPDTVYHWASITKIATTVAILQLREQGLIDLDAPASDYLDYFPVEYPIAVRHLLSHSSGLPEPIHFVWDHLRLAGQPLPDFDLVDREFYEWVSGVSGLMFEPGAENAYANPDMLTLGQIVARASGQPYIEYVQEHILAPLGMENTDFTYSSEAMIANAAAGAVPADQAESLISLLDEARGLGDGADFFRETDDRHAWMNRYLVGESAGGGLIGPPTELARFAQMLLNGGELDGVRILSRESVALMQEVQLSTSGEPLAFGLGWYVIEDSEHPYLYHDGGGAGDITNTVRLYLEDGLAVVLLSNGSGFDREEVVDAAANVVFSMAGRG